MATLDLVAHVTRLMVHRDVRGCLFPIINHYTDLARAGPFPASCLQHPSAMREILSKALVLVIEDDGSVNGLASDLLDCYLGTRSLHLCAEFEVVHATVMMSGDEEEAYEDEEEWREAIEALKVDYGFDSRGWRELGTCSICLDDLCCGNKKLIQTPCSHLYHESCIESWLEKKNNSCPLCRTQVLF